MARFPTADPGNYVGTRATSPPQQFFKDRAPLTTDNSYSIFQIGDEWLDRSVTPPVWYKLVSNAAGSANWRPTTQASGNPIATINTISPDGTGNFTIAAGAGITITPGANQISVAASGGGTAVDSFTVPVGTSPVVPNGSGVIDLPAGANITATGGLNSITFNVTGTTDHAVQVGNATGSLNSLPLGTTGQLLNGVTASDPAWVPAGSTGQVLTGVTGAAPAFSATPTVTSVTFGAGNPLASYVEGTWVPVLTFGGASVGITGTFDGTYTRIGRLVFIAGGLILTSKGVSVGNARITGLPFSAAPTVEFVANIPYFSVLTLDVNYTGVFMDFGIGAPGSLFQVGSGQNVLALDDTNFANTTVLVFEGFYYAS